MLEKLNYTSFTLGIVVAWPIVLLMNAVIPDINNSVMILAGVIFLSIGLVFKTSVGMFYRRATLDDSPSAFWFNLGQAVGFIIFGLIA